MTKRITLADLACKNCARRAESALKSLTDVWKVDVSIPEGAIDVVTEASGDRLTAVLEKAGFFVKKIETISDEKNTERPFFFPSPNINQ